MNLKTEEAEAGPSGLAPWPGCIQKALHLSSGARFYRCALQVNPFDYLVRHQKTTDYASEDEYNKAVIEACRENKIEVIAVTDHYRVKHSMNLVQSARNAGLHAFAGFEAVTKDGVHFLCLFDHDKEDNLERLIGECGIHDSEELSPIGSKDTTELLDCAKSWGAICIAAHVASEGGLLKKLSGQSRISAWKHPYMLACALPGPVMDAPEEIRPILENKNAQYKRDHRPAIINASDVHNPEDLNKNKSSCYIKMSNVSVEAFRQAFLDPDSRVQLHSDPPPESHAEFLAMTWEGGFLNDTAVHFNKNLNVLVGGRGTGKSTMIESMRYVLGLDPIGEETRKTHEGIIKQVLKSGTKVSLLVRSHKPSERYYLIERSVPNPPVVKDESGEVLALAPGDVMPGVEVFGQHEISELAKSPDKLTLLLERFVDQSPSMTEKKENIRLELERSRKRMMDIHLEVQRIKERLARLPSLEEMQNRFQKAGLEEKLKEKSLLVREERLFSNLNERLERYRTLNSDLAEGLPIDTTFVSSKALDGLPNADIFSKIEDMLQTLSKDLSTVSQKFETALSIADKEIADIKSNWNERRSAIEENYEKLLRELQKLKIDGAEFIQIRQQIEELRPLRDRNSNLKRDLAVEETQRRNLLAEWEDIKAAEYRKIYDAAKRVSKKLNGRVRVEVTMGGNRNPLMALLREVGGNLAAALDRLLAHEPLSLQELASRCQEGKESLKEHYGFPDGAAERIADADTELFMRIEELELPTITDIELNTASEGESPVWQKLQDLSTGQKATAVLLLLLLDSDTPLVVDQPEDDLDNRFITEGVVPIMRQEKCRRQFVFSTHNANIPVLGDAELILGLAATGETTEDREKIPTEHAGAIDSKPVRELVEEILEGGKIAFEIRRSKYGF